MTAPSGTGEPPDTELGRFMDERRVDLDWTWDDVANATGLTRQTLYDIRKGNTNYKRMRSGTKRKIETAFQWPRGSMDAAILRGARPLAQADVHTRQGARSLPELREDDVVLSPEEEALYLDAVPAFQERFQINITRRQFRYMRDQYIMERRMRALTRDDGE